MKTTALVFGFILSVFSLPSYSQDRTMVIANSNEISDNLDLRAVAHVFGEADNLEDFERRLNDPSLKISNLDLNYDNQVDYMRVIESVEDNTHLIIIQAVIGQDSFQDIATIEVEKDRRNKTVQVQVVGNTFIYGSNYIYEPVYYHAPIIYRHFWVPNYVAYYSPWAWSYYPNFFYAWNPWRVYTYYNHVNYYVNVNNACYYTNYRRSNRAVAMHHSYRGNAYERQNPNRSFSDRNRQVTNRHELAQTRGRSSSEGRTASAASTRDRKNTTVSQTGGHKSINTTNRGTVATGGTRGQNGTSTEGVRGTESIRTIDRTTSGSRDRSAAKGQRESVDRSIAYNSRSNNETTTRASETRTSSKSSPSVDRISSKPARSSEVSMNQKTSKTNVSSSATTRSNSSSTTRSADSGQRNSGGKSGNSSTNRGGRG